MVHTLAGNTISEPDHSASDKIEPIYIQNMCGFYGRCLQVLVKNLAYNQKDFTISQLIFVDKIFEVYRPSEMTILGF